MMELTRIVAVVGLVEFTHLLLVVAAAVTINPTQVIYQERIGAERDGSLCGAALFTCGVKNCVAKSQVCDGRDDCGDGSDEVNCERYACTSTSRFSCNNDGRTCVTVDKVCDGFKDCPNGHDEVICGAALAIRTYNRHPVCPGPDFSVCRNPYGVDICLGKHQVCDSVVDCADGSDEEMCWRNQCPSPGYFTCRSVKKCVGETQVCDGRNDCWDNSDEEDCGYRGDGVRVKMGTKRPTN